MRLTTLEEVILKVVIDRVPEDDRAESNSASKGLGLLGGADIKSDIKSVVMFGVVIIRPLRSLVCSLVGPTDNAVETTTGGL